MNVLDRLSSPIWYSTKSKLVIPFYGFALICLIKIIFIYLMLIANILYKKVYLISEIGIPINLEHYKAMILGILFAPLIETFIFCTLPMQFISLLREKHKYLIIIVSGIIFGSFHNYTISLQVLMSVIGIIYFGIYYIIDKNDNNSYLTICILHSVSNITNYIFGIFVYI